MLPVLKAAVSIVAGLLVFVAPLLHTGEQELGLVGRAGAFLGIVPTLLLCLLKGRRWLTGQVQAHARMLGAGFVVLTASLAFYLWIYLRAQVPSPALFQVAWVAYGVFTLLGSAALTALAFTIADRLAGGRR